MYFRLDKKVVLILIMIFFSEIDQYGFERAEDFDYESYEKFMAEYLSVLARRLAKWEKMLNVTNDVSRSTKGRKFSSIKFFHILLIFFHNGRKYSISKS